MSTDRNTDLNRPNCTLKHAGQILGISREAVRQGEASAFRKIAIGLDRIDLRAIAARAERDKR